MANPLTRAEMDAEIIRLLKCVRPLDCGAHYCRYCPAKSPEWEHGPYCPYVQSQRDTDAARAVLTALAAPAINAHARKHARELVDMYRGLKPSEKISKGTLAAMAIGLLEQFVAEPTSAAPAPGRCVGVDTQGGLSGRDR